MKDVEDEDEDDNDDEITALDVISYLMKNYIIVGQVMLLNSIKLRIKC